MKKSTLSLMAILAVGHGFAPSASGASELLWSIGDPDGSHREFALFGRHMDFAKKFPNDVRYIIGESRPSDAWPGVHPGSSDAWVGSKRHPYRIEFSLPKLDKGSYLLRIDLVDTHPADPGQLKAVINGDTTVMSSLPGGAGPRSLNDPTKGQPFHLDIPLDSDSLRRGENAIELTAEGSWLIWDAIQFHHVGAGVRDAVFPGTFGLDVTPLFLERGEGLVQVAELSMTLVRPTGGLMARIRVGGDERRYAVSGGTPGSIRQKIEIPEITTRGELSYELWRGDDRLLSEKMDVRPSRKWTIHVVPQAHVDVGFTQRQNEAMEVHRKSNDLAVELIDKYPKFMWSVESSYVMKDWLKTRPLPLKERFFARAKTERIEVGAFYGNLLTGLISDEEAFRSLYYSKKLSREHDIEFLSATLTDAPSHIWSVPTILRKSGIKYLSMGLNQTRGPLLRQGLNKKSPVWWEGQDGSRVLAFFHDHYGWASKIGLTGARDGGYEIITGLERAEERIPWLISLYDREDYPFDSIHLHGAYGDNLPLTEDLPKRVKAWNEKYAFPKIVFSSNSEWFSKIEKSHGEHLQTVRGDGGAYWEDGAGSSALETAINRQNQQDALLAEMLLTGLYAQGEIHEDLRREFMDIWHGIMMYNEHTWGSHHSVSKPELSEVKEQFRYKAQFAYGARARLDLLLEKADQLVAPGVTELASEGSLEGSRYTTPFYALDFDMENGGIRSIVDLESKQELLDPKARYLCGQVVYARNEKPPYDLTTASFVSLTQEGSGVVLRLAHPMMPKVKLTVGPGAGGKRLDFKYEIEKLETYDKEGVYIAFPFSGEAPIIDYSVANAVVRAGRDWLPGACKDWFAVQNWVRVRNPEFDVLWATLEAPLINLQDINSNKWIEELPIENGHVFGYIMNNYWFTNYKASQGGEFEFRFALTSGPSISNARAVEFGRDWSQARRVALEEMISVGSDNVIISAFKRSEDGRGYIVRLREMGGRATRADLRVPALESCTDAFLANGVEDVGEKLVFRDGRVEIDLGPWDVVTVKIQ